MRVLADGQIHTLTDANRFYNLSVAICYSYGTDNKGYNTVWSELCEYTSKFTPDGVVTYLFHDQTQPVIVLPSVARACDDQSTVHLD